MKPRHKLRRGASPIGVLDIGTSKTVCLIADLRGASAFDIIGVGVQPSRGLKAGVVIELDAAEHSVRAAVTEAERAAGIELRQVLLSVACGRLKSSTFAADTRIESRTVSRADIGRLMSAGRQYVERDGRALVHMNCIGYRLDGSAGIDDPCGMAGNALSAELHAVAADDAPLRNLVHVAERAYLSVCGLVPAPYASSMAVTTAEERRTGVVSLDFGAGTTSIAVHADGHLLCAEVVPVGSNHVTFDIARSLRTSLAEAERIKTLYGSVGSSGGDGQESFSFSPADGDASAACRATKDSLRDIVRNRMAGLLAQVAERTERAGVLGDATQRLVLTGGGSEVPGLVEFAGEYFGKPVRLGSPEVRQDLMPRCSKASLAAAFGLARIAPDPAAGVRREERDPSAAGYLRSVGRWLQTSF